MKTRFSALAITISAFSMLTACGSGGGPTSIDASPTAPKVTVTAPKTAIAGTAFNVAWTTAGATTSCSSSDLTGVSATSGTVSQTETVVATKTYSVTCTGMGGTTTGTATVQINAALPEGLWQGTTGSGRTVTGVVTKEGNYWLVYTKTTDATIVGFYAGLANTTSTTALSGTLASSNLRQVDFFAGTAKEGAVSSADYVAKSAINNGVLGVGSASTTLATFSGITMAGTTQYTSTSGLNGAGVLDFAGTLTVTFPSETTDLNGAPGSSAVVANVVDVFTGNLVGNTFTITGGTETKSGPCTGMGAGGGLICSNLTLPTHDTLTASGTIDLTGGTITAAFTASGVVTSITHTLPAGTLSLALPPISPDTFNLGTYNPAYETAASLAAVAGSYTTGSTGIDTALHADASLTVDSSGGVTGTESVSHCNYAATLAPHTTGNVYDVTGITFTNNGGTCAYTGATFTGVATYNATAKTLTLTALNAGRDKGFMVVATKP